MPNCVSWLQQHILDDILVKSVIELMVKPNQDFVGANMDCSSELAGDDVGGNEKKTIVP